MLSNRSTIYKKWKLCGALGEREGEVMGESEEGECQLFENPGSYTCPDFQIW